MGCENPGLRLALRVPMAEGERGRGGGGALSWGKLGLALSGQSV